MTLKERIECDLGPQIYKDDNHIIRAKTDSEGTLHLFVHKRRGDNEVVPRGYIGGGNYLRHRKEETFLGVPLPQC